MKAGEREERGELKDRAMPVACDHDGSDDTIIIHRPLEEDVATLQWFCTSGLYVRGHWRAEYKNTGERAHAHPKSQDSQARVVVCQQRSKARQSLSFWRSIRNNATITRCG